MLCHSTFDLVAYKIQHTAYWNSSHMLPFTQITNQYEKEFIEELPVTVVVIEYFSMLCQ